MPTLRELLAGPDPVLAPGAYDALSARLAVMRTVREYGTPAALDLPDFDAFTTMIGLPEVRELEARFASD